MKQRVITVLLEYVPSKESVIVRAAWDGDGQTLEPLDEGNTQNYVTVFEGIDMKHHVGFSGLQ